MNARVKTAASLGGALAVLLTAVGAQSAKATDVQVRDATSMSQAAPAGTIGRFGRRSLVKPNPRGFGRRSVVKPNPRGFGRRSVVKPNPRGWSNLKPGVRLNPMGRWG
jgi:hypothetical protein